MDAVGIVPLTDDRVEIAAGVLSRAFDGDPGLLFVVPEAERRLRLAPVLAEIGLRFAVRCGSPLVTSGVSKGVAIWFAPDAPPPTKRDLLESGISDAPYLLGSTSWKRLKGMLDHLDELHQQLIAEPHWYLTVLGVDPTCQRQGIGEALMQPVFAAANGDGLPCYLEAPTLDNARYYERRGFCVIGETDIPESDVHIWFMRRDPEQ